MEVTYYDAETAEIWRSFKRGIEDEQCATADTVVLFVGIETKGLY